MIRSHRLSRRAFLGAAATTAAFSIVPSHVLGQTPPSEQFRFAKIGCGGRGAGSLKSTLDAGGKLAGLCDVDPQRAAKAFEQHPAVPRFTDYRVMLDKLEKELDGVVVSTPDHLHGAQALDAMRRGKHVYVEKPLARTYQECQLLLEASRKYRVVTQMGNQGHAGKGLVLWQKMWDAGIFGDIERIDTWSNRPTWPQGMTEAPKPEPVPAGLSWEDWIGPVAMQPYSSAYVPFKWRGWWDFGCGAMGDMACHNMDPAFFLLQLGLPTSVKAQASAPAGVAYPEWSIIEYTFAATKAYPKPIKLTWYDGKKLPELPKNSHPNLTAGANGCMIIGSKASAKGGSHAGAPTVIALGDQPYGPSVKDAETQWAAQLKTIEVTEHHARWIQAAKAGKASMPGSHFEYSVPMTQAILLGCIALRFPGQELRWDNDKRQFSNHAEANKWLSFQPRPGYSFSL